ncbi:MAG: NAD(P)/FAD-dependent oxidoreductase [Granulosicoccus sp.]
MSQVLDDTELAYKALQGTTFDSYWIDSLDPVAPNPGLSSDVTCDLLIVGGGFCGLWAAIQAMEKQADRKVILIEAQTIGSGASGRPAAIMSTSVMHGIDNTQRQFPGEVHELERLGQLNMTGFRQTIERYNIDCDIEWGGELKVAVDEHAIDTIDTDYQLYCKYGHKATKLDKKQVQAQVNSPVFQAGVWSTALCGTVHPGKLLQGLKQLARDLGVEIYEKTPHLTNHLTQKGIKVSTPNAMITAKKVFLATNAWAAGHKRIKSRVAAIRDRIIVTEPLSVEQMASVGWSNRQGIYDTRTQLNYLRLTKDNRILFGGRLGYFFGNNIDPAHDKTPEPYIRLAKSFYRTFPQLKDQIRFSHAWSGPIGLTSRMAVHYQRFYRGDMVFAGGYSGFGVTASRFGARVGLAILDKDEIPETQLSFAITEPAYIPPEPFRWIGAKITLYALDTLDEKGGWRIPWVRFVERMGFPIS